MIVPSVENYDAVVIGGGPAGSTVSALLAQKGRRVVLLEREKFPRYHIGESLLPFCYFPLQRLGMLEKMKASRFTKKYSVQFVRTDGTLSVPFYFHKHLQHECAQTWQVLRGEFDQMLLDNARRLGVTVHEETLARDFLEDGSAVAGVRAEHKGGAVREYRAPMTIDASGRDAFAITRHDWLQRDPQLNKIAVWTYYQGALRDPGLDGGATTVAYVPEKGWFWYIPLHGDIVSVGVVAERAYLQRDTTDPETIFHAQVKQNKWIERHLAPGKALGPYRVTAEYSYRSRHCARDGLVLCGDAFGFLDPVFSSGVCLALRTGELAADAVDAALSAGDVSAARFTEYGRRASHGIESMRRLVYAFYDTAFHFRELFAKYPETRGQVTDCLIGDLFRDYNELYRKVAEFAGVPEPLTYGAPASSAAVADAPAPA